MLRSGQWTMPCDTASQSFPTYISQALRNMRSESYRWEKNPGGFAFRVSRTLITWPPCGC